MLVNGTPFGFFQSSRGLRRGFFFPFFVCSNHTGAELPIGEGQGGEFLVKFLDKRQGGEAMEVSHFLFFYL